jgi:hypothetical protein
MKRAFNETVIRLRDEHMDNELDVRDYEAQTQCSAESYLQEGGLPWDKLLRAKELAYIRRECSHTVLRAFEMENKICDAFHEFVRRARIADNSDRKIFDAITVSQKKKMSVEETAKYWESAYFNLV